MKEFEFINWIRSHEAIKGAAEVIVGPGDDCAVVRLDGEIVITTDQCVDGVHFDVSKCGACAAAAKTFKRSLSDIAAMGAIPLAAVATVAIAAGENCEKFSKLLHDGLRAESEKFNCPIVGGDVSIIPSGKLHMTVTMWGKCATKPILRSTAQTGDLILVTGTLGQSWQSGHDLDFTPRIHEAAILAEKYTPTAMMDISDGLAGDICHICSESKLGVVLYRSKIPVSKAAAKTQNPLKAALSDGEDYELLFTANEETAHKIISDKPFETPVTIIGQMTESPDIQIETDGKVSELKKFAAGFEHSS